MGVGRTCYGFQGLTVLTQKKRKKKIPKRTKQWSGKRDDLKPLKV